VAGKPASDRKLLPQFAQEQTGGFTFDFLTFQAQTDQDGHYVFTHVPPGKLKLLYLAFHPPNSFAHVPLNNSEVEILPGETTTKDLGGQGYVVTTHLVWPDGIKPAGWRCFGSIGPVPPSALRDALKDPEKLEALKDSPEVADYTRSAKSWHLQAKDLYTLTGEEIPPGEYMIFINAFQMEGKGASTSLMGRSAVITIPSGPLSGSFDAGSIQLQALQFAQTQK
jgi:hypothetical protein